MKHTSITLTDELADLVENEARRRRISVSELIRGFVRQCLLGTGDRPRAIPWAGIFDDPGMIAGRKVDEELAEHWKDELDRDR